MYLNIKYFLPTLRIPFEIVYPISPLKLSPAQLEIISLLLSFRMLFSFCNTFLGCIVLLICPLFYTIIVVLIVCIKLAILFESNLCDIPFLNNILVIASRLPSNTDLGWYFTSSSFSLLGLCALVMSMKFIVRTLSIYLHSWDLNGKVNLYSILFSQLIGLVLLLDSDFIHVRMVYSFNYNN
jgi:hypothetical protein